MSGEGLIGQTLEYGGAKTKYLMMNMDGTC